MKLTSPLKVAAGDIGDEIVRRPEGEPDCDIRWRWLRLLCRKHLKIGFYCVPRDNQSVVESAPFGKSRWAADIIRRTAVGITSHELIVRPSNRECPVQGKWRKRENDKTDNDRDRN